MYRFITSDGKNFLVSYPVDTTITVNENSILRAVPSDFGGLSVNINVVFDFITLGETTPSVLQLYKNLGTSIMRMGVGDSRYWYPDTVPDHWPPTTYINKDTVDRVCAIIEEIDWNVIWLLNLRAYDDPNGTLTPTEAVAMFSNEANYIYGKLGSRLIGFEIGNEPDNYYYNGLRDPSYTYADYLTDWAAYKTAIKAYNSAIPLCGPSVGDMEWLHNFSVDKGSDIEFLNFHLYPTGRTGTGTIAPTIQNILSKRLMDSIKSDIVESMGYATTAGLPLVMGESNSVGTKGVDGVSNTFAATLYGLDYMFHLLEKGYRHVSFHGSYEYSDSYYGTILQGGIPGPLYYSLLCAHYAAPNGNSVSSVTTTSNNVSGHAVVKADGSLSVVIVNKDVNYPAHVKITPAGIYSMATAIFLTAPAINSKTGITLGGNAVAADGTWTAGTPTNLQIIDGSALITMPTGSAAVVTLTE